MKKIIVIGILMLVLASCLSGCSETSQTISKTITFKTPDNETKLIMISSDKSYWNDQDEEVTKELEAFMTKPDIVIYQVNTYVTQGYLLRVEIWYKELNGISLPPEPPGE